MTKNIKKNKKLVVGLTTATLIVPSLIGITSTTGLVDNVANAYESGKTDGSIMYLDTHPYWLGKYKQGEKPTIFNDLGFRGYTPYGNKMVPQTPFSNPRVKAAVYLHNTHTEGSDTYGGSGSGVFIAPNVMLTVAHNYLDDSTKTIFNNFKGHAYIAGTYLFPSGYFNSDDYPDASRVTLPNQVGTNVFFRDGAYGGNYEPVSDRDIAVVVFPRPVQLMVPGAEPRPIVKDPYSNTIGSKIYNVGYPSAYQANDGVLNESVGVVLNKPGAFSLGVTPVSADSQSGNSGGGVFNDNNEVIGAWVGSHNGDGKGNSEFNSFTPLTATNHAWVKGLLAKHAIKEWYQEGASWYYFDPETGQMAQNENKIIGDHEYRFDNRGVMVEDLGVIKKGTIKVRYVDVDTKQEIKGTETAIDNERIGRSYDLNGAKVDIPEYEFVSVQDNVSLTGNLEEGEKVITFQYRKKVGNVTVVYKGDDGKELGREEVRDQKYGSVYNAPKKDFDGYELQGQLPTVTVSKPNETLEVIYKKLEKGQVKVRFVSIDEDNKELGKEDVTQLVWENQNYSINPKTFDRYDYVGVDGGKTLQGKVGRGETTITLQYKLKRGTLTVNYRSGSTILDSDILGDLKYGTNKEIKALDFEGYTPREAAKSIMIEQENSVLDLEYDRIKNNVTIKYVTNEGEVLATETKEVFYFDEFTPEIKDFKYTEYLNGAEKVQIKGDREITLNYKRLLAGGVRLVYKHGEEIVQTKELVEGGKRIETPYKVDAPESGEFEANGKTYAIISHVSGDLEGKLEGAGVDIVYYVKEVTHTTDVQDTVLPYETEYIDDDTLDVGREVVEQLGKDGVKTVTFDVTNHDGVEASRSVVKEDVQKPVNKVVRRGTKVAPEETSAAVVIAYEHKGDQIKETTLLEAGSPLGAEYESKLEKGDRIKIKDKTYVVKEIDGELKGKGTTTPERIKVKIVEFTTETTDEEIKIPFETEYVADESLELDVQEEDVVGVEGVTTVTYEKVYEDGVEVSKRAIKVVETSKPVKRIVKIGRKGATDETPDIVQPEKPVLPEVPTVDGNASKVYETRWVVKGEDGKDIDLTDAIINDKEFKEKITFFGYHLVDTKEDKEKNVKTYIYEKDKEPEQPTIEPTDEDQDNHTTEITTPGGGGGVTNPSAVVDEIGNTNGVGVNGNGGTNLITNGSKGGRLSSTGLDNGATTAAGVLTLIGAALLGVFTRKKTK